MTVYSRARWLTAMSTGASGDSGSFAKWLAKKKNGKRVYEWYHYLCGTTHNKGYNNDFVGLWGAVSRVLILKILYWWYVVPTQKTSSYLLPLGIQREALCVVRIRFLFLLLTKYTGWFTINAHNSDFFFGFAIVFEFFL